MEVFPPVRVEKTPPQAQVQAQTPKASASRQVQASGVGFEDGIKSCQNRDVSNKMVGETPPKSSIQK